MQYCEALCSKSTDSLSKESPGTVTLADKTLLWQDWISSACVPFYAASQVTLAILLDPQKQHGISIILPPPMLAIILIAKSSHIVEQMNIGADEHR